MEAFVTQFCKEIAPQISEGYLIEETPSAVSITADLKTGVKGIEIIVECNEKNIKVKGKRQYEYPISEQDVENFQNQIQSEFPGSGVFVKDQTLSYSKFFVYESEENAKKNILNAINELRKIVPVFEQSCINFLEKQEIQKEEEYNPEKNVDIINVDNSFKSSSITQTDNEKFDKREKSYSEKIFHELAKKYCHATPKGNTFSIKEKDKFIRCTKYEDKPDLLIYVSIPLDQDISQIYASHIRANFPELQSGYDNKHNAFFVKGFATPSEYTPKVVQETIDSCIAALDSCVKEFAENMEKRESSDYAFKLQEVVKKQADIVDEREKKVDEKEKEIFDLQKRLETQMEECEDKLSSLNREREIFLKEKETFEQDIILQRKEMEAEIKRYKDSKTKDLLNMHQLANQISELQNRLSNKTGEGDNSEELFRLQSRVKQITIQRVAMEKALTERLNQKDEKLLNLSDTISEKDREIAELQKRREDVIHSSILQDRRRVKSYIQSLEKKIKEQGHRLTADEVISYYQKIEGEDMDIKKRIGQNATVVTYEEGTLSIRIIFEKVNIVEVSKVASIDAKKLKRLNEKYGDIKFYCREKSVVARAYFANNATLTDVENITEELCEKFKK